MIRDGRYAWAAAIVFFLLTAALLTGWKQYAATARERGQARQDERARWLGQGEKNPHSAAHYGVYAFKPELPLSALDRGLNAYLGVAVWLEAHKQNLFKFRPADDATAASRFGELTAAAVLQLLIPLLIVLVLHSAFTGEREQGTLRLLASLGVPPRRLAYGKVLGALAALGVLLVPAALLGALALWLAAGAESAMTSVSRTLLTAGGYLLYFGIFCGLALLVSARAKSSQAALVVLLAAAFSKPRSNGCAAKSANVTTPCAHRRASSKPNSARPIRLRRTTGTHATHITSAIRKARVTHTCRPRRLP
jgi:ABC-2 type transport system permease protein